MNKDYLCARIAVLATLLCIIGWYYHSYIFSIIGTLIMMYLIIIFLRNSKFDIMGK